MPTPRSSFTWFSHPLVRDLYWMLDPNFDLLAELPPYRRFIPPQPSGVLDAWLRDLQSDPQPLEAFMNRPSLQRLGLYFEQLVLFYLNHGPDSPFQVLDHNRVIFQDSPEGHPVTIGELDFLLAGPSGCLHLETAVKFYLGVERDGGTHWVGPNLHDWLDRKLQRLHDHQLPLSRILEREPIERCFWLKGVLFHPWLRPRHLADGLVAQNPLNFWLTCSQAQEVLSTSADWRCLTRQNWLGCAWSDADVIANPTQIRQHFAASTRALMLWSEKQKTRCMIVADDWLASAQAMLSTAV